MARDRIGKTAKVAGKSAQRRMTVVKTPDEVRRDAFIAMVHAEPNPEFREGYWALAHPELGRGGWAS